MAVRLARRMVTDLQDDQTDRSSRTPIGQFCRSSLWATDSTKPFDELAIGNSAIIVASFFSFVNVNNILKQKFFRNREKRMTELTRLD
jgi:hypothetical protein